MPMDQVDDRRLVETVNYSLEYGDAQAVKDYEVSHETLARYKREYRKRFGTFDRRKLLDKIAGKYTDEELKTIAAGQRTPIGVQKHVVTREGEQVKFGFMTDTHIGSIFFREELFLEAVKRFEAEGCDFIVHSGDVVEGMSNRPDQIYSLTHLGYEAQKDYACELISRIIPKVYMISGNHDRWYIKSSGANIVRDIAEETGNIFLGHDEGDLLLDGATIRLWHGEDAGSYSTSYRLQKLIESFSGGEKPHVLLAGHTHKQGYFFDRNIHVVSGGALSLQSNWMRSKRLANHTGYHIIEMTITDDGVTRFKPEFFPFFL